MAHPEAALRHAGAGPRPGAAVGGTSPSAAEAGAEDEPRDERRLRQIFDDHFSFVWRYLRRMGLSSADADDAAQQVFVVLSRKLDRVELGKEKAFLCGTAIRVCSEVRRARSRRREVHEVDYAEPVDHRLGPEGVADRERARALLDSVLDQMDDPLRTVFVLFEMEELSTAEIAAMVDVPTGTAASRLRRAREQFHAIIKRMRAGGQLPEEER
ncbi:MAG: sigma-70 family RNA polymerase sigma factor [Polyangiaceae bacterium]